MLSEEVLHPAVPPLQAAHEELLHRYQELKAKKMEGLQDVLAAQAAQVLTPAVCHTQYALQAVIQKSALQQRISAVTSCICTAVCHAVHCIAEPCTDASVICNRWRSTVRRQTRWQSTGRRRRRAMRPPLRQRRPRR